MTRQLIADPVAEHTVTLWTNQRGELCSTELNADICTLHDAAVLWSGEAPADTPQEST